MNQKTKETARHQSIPHVVTEWLERARQGDEVAINALFEYELPRIRRYAGALIQQKNIRHALEAADLLAKVYLDIEKTSYQFPNRKAFRAVVYLSLKHKIEDERRKLQPTGRISVQMDEAEETQIQEALIRLRSFERNIETKLGREIVVKDLLQELKEQDETWLSIIFLKYWERLRTHEIAEIMGVSVPTVNRIHRAALDFCLKRLQARKK